MAALPFELLLARKLGRWGSRAQFRSRGRRQTAALEAGFWRRGPPARTV